MVKVVKRQVSIVIGEPNRFCVSSDQPGEHPYFVDLEYYGGNGKCTCIDFAVHEKEVKEIAGKGSYFFRCKHLEAAFNFKALLAVSADMETKSR
jgi:hypothetical protein